MWSQLVYTETLEKLSAEYYKTLTEIFETAEKMAEKETKHNADKRPLTRAYG